MKYTDCSSGIKNIEDAKNKTLLIKFTILCYQYETSYDKNEDGNLRFEKSRVNSHYATQPFILFVV